MIGGLRWRLGAPYVVPAGDGGALGLATNPASDQTLYVGFPVAGDFGVYDIDPSTGVLNFVMQVAAGRGLVGFGPIRKGNAVVYAKFRAECGWRVQYGKSAGADSDQHVYVEGFAADSGDFSLGFSPDGGTLYVVSQNVDTTFATNNNWLHVLKVAVDGTVSEPGSLCSFRFQMMCGRRGSRRGRDAIVRWLISWR